eukprot:657709-Rhodomonas_salina.2
MQVRCVPDSLGEAVDCKCERPDLPAQHSLVSIDNLPPPVGRQTAGECERLRAAAGGQRILGGD